MCDVNVFSFVPTKMLWGSDQSSETASISSPVCHQSCFVCWEYIFQSFEKMPIYRSYLSKLSKIRWISLNVVLKCEHFFPFQFHRDSIQQPKGAINTVCLIETPFCIQCTKRIDVWKITPQTKHQKCSEGLSAAVIKVIRMLAAVWSLMLTTWYMVSESVKVLYI